MTTIESSRLLLMRVQKAVGLIRHLRDENKELLARFTLVENHNKELQDLYDKLSTDQAAIDQAIASALEELDTSLGDLEGFEDFGTLRFLCRTRYRGYRDIRRRGPLIFIPLNARRQQCLLFY